MVRSFLLCLVLGVAACPSGGERTSAPRPAEGAGEDTLPAPSPDPTATTPDPPAEGVHLSPAVLTFTPSVVPRSTVGRGSWPATDPEPPYFAASRLFIEPAQTRIEDGRLVVGVKLLAGPGLDPTGCVLEVLWGEREGVQVSRPSSVEPAGGETSQGRWAVEVPMETASLSVLSISAFAFCQDDVQLVSTNNPIPGPGAHDALCSRPRPQTDGLDVVALSGEDTSALLRATCATLLRRRGNVLVDACEPDRAIMDLSRLRVGITLNSVPREGTPLTHHELRWLLEWKERGRSEACSGEVFRLLFDGPVGSAGAAYLQTMVRRSPAIVDLWSLHGMEEP